MIEKREIVVCPSCGDEMIKRNGKFGVFYGCKNYPVCRQTVPVEKAYRYTKIVSATLRDFQIPKIQVKHKPENIKHIKDAKKCIPTSEYKIRRFLFEKFNPPQTAVLKYTNDDINMIISSPTSSGKTVMVEFFIGSALSKNKNAIYVSPYKALAMEKYREWKKNYSVNTTIITSDFEYPNINSVLNKSQIVLMTAEALHSRLIKIDNASNWLFNTDVLILDEFHMITSENRGETLESLIMAFCKYNKNARIIISSATLSNLDEIASWISALTQKKTVILKSQYRPVKLDIHFVSVKNTRDKSDYIKAVISLLKKYKKDKFLIFVHSRKFGYRIAEEINNKVGKAKFHNATLDLNERTDIENDFLKGDLKYLVSTSTLAYGVNLPARRVIVVGVQRGNSYVPSMDIQQSIGRSGRAGIDEKGDAYILISNKQEEKQKKHCLSATKLVAPFSNLKNLIFHLLAEIYRENIKMPSDLIEWYKRTFAYYQGYRLELEHAEFLFSELQRFQAICKNENGYFIAPLGKIAMQYYFHPETIYEWTKNITKLQQGIKNDNDALISYAVFSASVYAKNYIPDVIKDIVSIIDDELYWYNIKLSRKNRFAVATMYLFLKGAHMESDAKIFSREISLDAKRIVSCLRSIDNVVNGSRIEGWDMLEKRLSYGIPLKLLELVSIPNIGRERALQLYQKGIKNIEDFVNYPLKAKEAIGEKIYENSLKKLPQVWDF